MTFLVGLWQKRQWILAAALAVAVVFGVYSCQSARRANAEVVKYAETAKAKADPELADAGVVVGDIESVDTMKQKLADAAARNEDFARELAAAQKEIAHLRALQVGHFDSGAIPLAPGATPIVYGPPLPPSTPAQPCPVRPACLLDVDSTPSVELDEAHLVSDSGTSLLLAGVSVYRLTPPPKVKLFSDSFSTKLSNAAVSDDAAGLRPLAEEKRATLSLLAGWDPANLQTKPELAAFFDYKLVWIFGAWAEVGTTYTTGAAQTLYGRGGIRADIPLF